MRIMYCLLIVAFGLFFFNAGSNAQQINGDVDGRLRVTIGGALDTDKIVVKSADGSERIIELLGVLPFSKWPTELTMKEATLKREMESKFKSLLRPGAGAFAIVRKEDKSILQGDLYLLEQPKWNGKTPAEEVGWGVTHLNALLLQEGVTLADPRSPKIDYVDGLPKTTRDDFLKEAEKYAVKGKVGIWSDAGLLEKLRVIVRERGK